VVNDTYKPNPWDGVVNTMALQADGMLVIGGTFQHADTAVARNRLARLNADGWVDPTFDPDVNGEVKAVAVQADGKILVGGSFTTVGGLARSYLTRLLPTGAVDPGFSAVVDGVVTTLVARPDGKIWVGGQFNQVNGVACAALAFLDADGAIATERDNLGAVTWTYASPFDESQGGNYFVSRLLLTSANELVVVAQETVAAANLLWRMRADGRRDTGFTAPSINAIYALGEQSTGKLVIGGAFLSVSGDATRQRLARLNADGSLDTTFSQPYLASEVDVVLVLSGDRILATSPGLNSKFQCHSADGAIEYSFDAPLSVFMSASTPTSLVAQPDGKIIANAGQQGLTRLNADGTLDTSTQALSLWTTGGNAYGKLGIGSYNGTSDQSVVPTLVAGAKAVAVGGQHMLFVKDDGTLWAAGRNDQGQLGDDPASLAYTSDGQPQQVAGVTDVAAVAAGSNHSFFIKTDGTLWAMGDNTGGKLGNRNTTDQYAPVQIATGVAAVAAGVDHSLYITTGGSLYVMGSNTQGQLGTSSYTNTPVLVATGVKAVAAGDYFSLYLKTDGKLYGMGQNSSGQLGQGDTTNRSTPVLIASDVAAIAAGANHTAYVMTGGHLFTMGDNSAGQLGYTAATTTSAQQVPGLILAATQVACGGAHTLFLKSDATLWGMGRLSKGALGQGTRAETSTTVPVKIAHYIRAISAQGDQSAFLTRGDAALPGQRVTISDQPQTATVADGVAHTLSVTATGAGTLTYQWYKVGGPFGGGLIGATQSTYALSAFSASDAGTYYVEVTNDWGAVTSEQAVLTLQGAPPVQAKFDSYVPPADGTYYTGEVLEVKMIFDQVVAVTGTPQLALTIGTQTRYADYVAGSTPTGGYGLTFRYTLAATDSDADGIAIVSPLVLNGGTIKDAQGDDAALSFTPISLSGVKVAQGPRRALIITAQPADVTAPHYEYVANFSCMAAGRGEIQHTWQYSADAGVTWVDAQATAWESVKDVPVSDRPTLTDLAMRSSVHVSTTLYVMTDRGLLNGYRYRCVVTDDNGFVTSQVAVLKVPPQITGQPVDQSVADRTVQANFSVTAVGAETYQWQAVDENGVGTDLVDDEAGAAAPVVRGAQTATLSLRFMSTTLVASGTCRVRCVVRNALCGDATNTVSLWLLPRITGQPGDKIETDWYELASFTVAAAEAQSFQWQIQRTDGSWTDLSDGGGVGAAWVVGANTSVLRINAYRAGGAKLRCVVSNPGGSVTTNAVSFVRPLAIRQQPVGQSVFAGTTVTFTLDTAGLTILGYEWQYSDDQGASWQPVSTSDAVADTQTLSVVGLLASSGRRYRCLVQDDSVVGIRTLISDVAMLTVTAPPPPQIEQQPESQKAAIGGRATFSVEVPTPLGYSYEWQFSSDEGATWQTLRAMPAQKAARAQASRGAASLAYSGEDTQELTIDNIGLDLYGYRFRCLVSNGTDTVISAVSILTLPWSQFSALSARAPAGTGEQTLILGFVFSGGGKPALVRGVGPAMADTVSGYLRDPQLHLFDVSGTEIASNDDWAGATDLADAFARTGAGALDPASKDAALSGSLTGSVYTAHVRGAGDTTGVALAEAYDANLVDKTRRLMALSVRNQVGTGADILIAGFVIAGDTPKRVIVRGVGPGLSGAVSAYLVDPKVQLYRLKSDGTGWDLVDENDDWDGTPEAAAAFASAGMGALAAGSKDAALLLALEPGIYTLQVNGAAGTSGVALAEIYEAAP